jgi:hypothetical protein
VSTILMFRVQSLCLNMPVSRRSRWTSICSRYQNENVKRIIPLTATPRIRCGLGKPKTDEAPIQNQNHNRRRYSVARFPSRNNGGQERDMVQGCRTLHPSNIVSHPCNQ